MNPSVFNEHGSLSCENHEHLQEFNRHRPYLRFQRDSCCFTCLLPTKICKGHFNSTDSCLTPPLMPIWMETVARHSSFIQERIPDFFEYIGLTTQQQRPEWFIQKLLNFEWQVLDTEVLHGVVLFIRLHQIFTEQSVPTT